MLSASLAAMFVELRMTEPPSLIDSEFAVIIGESLVDVMLNCMEYEHVSPPPWDVPPESATWNPKNDGPPF